MSKHDDDDELDLELDLDLSLDELELDEAPADGDGTGSSPGPTPSVASTPSGASPAEQTPAGGTPAPAELAAQSALLAGAAEPGGADSSGSAGASRVAEPEPVVAQPASAAASETPAAQVEGQWVWQYGAPPPPPSFSAVFFSGHALGELYRFFACGLMVFIGCLMPWGKSMAWVVEHGESTFAYAPPAGYELTAGAISMALALWLMGVACYGIYTGRQKILPVFLMLLPAWVTWSRMLDAWGLVSDQAFKAKLMHVSEVSGTGVLLAMIGSSVVTLQLLLVVVKVMRKSPATDGGPGGRTRKTKDAKPAKKEKPAKARGKDKTPDAGEGPDAGKGDAETPAAAEQPASNDGEKSERSGGRRRGRKR